MQHYPPSAQAILEGWCIMLAGCGEWQIQRDDEQRIFRSDDEALEHVLRCHLAGSEYHTECLAFVGILDTASSASRQHFIDTGRYLLAGEADTCGEEE